MSTREGFVLTPPFYCDHGNKICFGNHFYANTDLEYAKPVTIGNDVQSGGNVVINLSVAIGNNMVIGFGSVVTKDIPDRGIIAGNLCRVIREITEDEQRNWKEQYREYLEDRDCNK